MAQLDFFSYSDQYFLVATTFWLFYLGCVTLFITPFFTIMKVRGLVSNSICKDEDEIMINNAAFVFNRSLPEKNLMLFI